jgi:lysophospholipase L1-like esterase
MAAAKRILCFGDSNTWGFIPVPTPPTTGRYDREQRWPQVMAAALGQPVEVIEEALNGRTTDADDPMLPQIAGAGANGAAYLPAALASHLPLDLVIIMLGTNDVKPRLDRLAPRIALGAKKLLDIVRTIDGGVGTTYPNPKMLLVCPPPLGTLSEAFVEMFAGGHAKTAMLPALYEGVARMAGAAFLDAGRHIETDGVDGVHFSAETQRKLGLAIAGKARALLE